MPATAKDLYDELARIRYDLTAAQAKVTNVVNMLNTLHFPETRAGFKCAHCGVGRPTDDLLRDHLANVHGIEVR